MSNQRGRRYASSTNKKATHSAALSAKSRRTSIIQPVKKKKKNIALRFLAGILACFLVIFIGIFCVYSYYYGMLNYNDGEFEFSGVFGGADAVGEGADVSGELGDLINSMNSDLAEYDIISASDVTNILLLGVDDREEGYSARTDTMILVSICNNTDKIYLTSFMRDTWVHIPGYGYSRLNAANALGGPQLVMQTIEENFKIKVDRYAMVNFLTFVDVVNSVGGVEMTLTGDEVYYMNEYIRTYRAEFEDFVEQVPGGTEYISEAGTYRLNGVQALSYCRIRYVGDDFERTNRQRKVIGAIFNEAKGLNIAEISSLAEVLFPQIMTNITSMEVIGMCFNVGSYLSYDLLIQRVPADGTWYSFITSGGADVVGVDLRANIEMLRGTIYAES